MRQGKRVFSHLMTYMPPSTFARCLATRHGEPKVNDFTCLCQFFAMVRPLCAKEPSGDDMDAAACASGVTTSDPRLSLYFSKLFTIHQAQGFFVTGAKSNTQFRRRYSDPVQRSTTSVVCDQIGVLTMFYSSQDDPQARRGVVIQDELGKRIAFLANDFALKPELIAELNRQHWQVEMFFTWIKQHLRIKAFPGTSEDAVKTQV
jgi:hypothetical protein